MLSLVVRKVTTGLEMA